jgi:DNA repair photolyase
MKVIYTPKGRAREYSPLAANLYSGCSHGCRYCYGPATLRMHREDYTSAEAPRADIIEAFRKDAEKLDGSQQVLLSFLGDPYCPAEEEHRLTRQALEICLELQIPVAILTKGGERCLQDLDLFRAFGPHIKVGQSLTFDNLISSRNLEPGAARPDQRLKTFEALHVNHVPTWASMEPVIYPRQSLKMIEASLPYCDEYRLGKINHDPTRENSTDWRGYLEEALSLLRPLGKKIYVKNDLGDRAGDIHVRDNEIDQDRFNAAPWGNLE